MHQPVTALRFRDLILRTAEWLGVADYTDKTGGKTGKAQIPTKEHDLDRCERIVNDAWRGFATRSTTTVDGRPVKHSWRWLRQYFELALSATATDQANVDGDAARYVMPWWFSGVAHRDWNFSSDTVGDVIRVVSESEVERMRSGTGENTGPPNYCAFRRLPPDHPRSQQGRRWEAVFYPTPGESMTVNILLRAEPTGLQGHDDFHIAGALHDETIRQACIAQAEFEQRKEYGGQFAIYKDLLHESIQLDMRAGPRSLGFNIDPGAMNGNAKMPPAYHDGVYSYNGVVILPD